jgi:threonine dehydrogenase-like Zn-dependent dehydrogenase
MLFEKGEYIMRALGWNGVNDLRVETVPHPQVVNPHDAILRVSLSTTCRSDLHFIDGYLTTMREGDVIGHEFMGEVADVGREVKTVKKGDRVVVPFFYLLRGMLVLQPRPLARCATTPTRMRKCKSRCLVIPPLVSMATRNAFGGYAGSHAQYIRVPHADNDCFHHLFIQTTLSVDILILKWVIL